MTPLISVVIPVYNRREELRRALESLASQTMHDFEVIVCDDGSTDDIRAVMAPFDHRIDFQYQRIENSGGPARPRNVAIGVARGEWISFLDSDDWWDDNRIEVITGELHHDIDFLYHNLRVVNASDLSRARERRTVIGEPLRCEALRHMALFGNPVPNSTAVVRRSLLEKIGGVCEDRAIVAVEDFDTWLRLLEAGARIRYLNRILGSYFVGEDGISALSLKHIERQNEMFKRHIFRFDASFRDAAESSHNYMMGSMLLRLDRNSVLGKKYLLDTKNLPSLSLKFKKFIKLTLIALNY